MNRGKRRKPLLETVMSVDSRAGIARAPSLEAVILSDGRALERASEGSPDVYCVLSSGTGLTVCTSLQGDSSLRAVPPSRPALKDSETKKKKKKKSILFKIDFFV